MAETIFTRIINREIPADIVYEDEHTLAFRDINPQAPTHVLVIPKEPITNISTLTEEHREIMGHLMLSVAKVAKQLGLDDYRVITNTGAKAGQSVFHLHMHILGGADFSESALISY